MYYGLAKKCDPTYVLITLPKHIAIKFVEYNPDYTIVRW